MTALPATPPPSILEDGRIYWTMFRTQNLNTQEIADRCGVSQAYVVRAMAKARGR